MIDCCKKIISLRWVHKTSDAMRNRKENSYSWQRDARAKCDDDKNLQFSSRKKYSAARLMEKAFEKSFKV